MKMFRTKRSRELGQIQRHREDYEPVMITEEIQTSADDLDIQEHEDGSLLQEDGMGSYSSSPAYYFKGMMPLIFLFYPLK